MADIKNSVLPLYKKINDAQSDLFPLSLTAEFKVSLNLGYDDSSGGLSSWLTKCGIANSPQDLARYDFFASDVTLPGASFDMAESMGDRQGTIERFAQRRLYAPLTVSFYVDADYNMLRLFEEWMNFIKPIHNSSGRYEGSFQGQRNYRERNNYYKFRYPDDYRRMISITKFERDFLQNPNEKNNTFKNMPLLTYRFIDTFPVDINAVPMSYDGSTFLQVTVVFSYLRHTIEKHGNAQQSVRERLTNTNQLTQVNPLRPRAIGNEISPSTNSPVPDVPVGYVSGKPYYGPFHEHMGVKMVGVEHSSYPHAIIYATLAESLPGSTVSGETVTETNPVTETETEAGEGTSSTTR